MTIDLTGGMDPSNDHFLAARPDDPQFRESASVWVSDDAGLIGLPRIGIEAVAEAWDKRGLQLNLGFPDGRTFIVRGLGRRPLPRRRRRRLPNVRGRRRSCSVTSSRSRRSP